MKITLAVLALSFVSLAQASSVSVSVPASASTCYVAKSAVPEGAPKAICLRDLEITSNDGSVVLNTDLEDTVKKELKISSFVRHNEERAKFVAVLELQELTDVIGCSEAAQISATLSGQVNTTQTPAINAEALTVSVSYMHQNDSCHSPALETVLEYVLSK